MEVFNETQAAMPTYHFHVDNGTFIPDPAGTDLPNLDAAQVEAVRAAGEMINDTKQSFWTHKTPWIMHVTDDRNRLLFSLQFAAKVPSGDALYIPRTEESSAGQKESPAT
ncbi:MAG: hypothetical protein E5X23_09225 [Mesorhizobium sp.]|uniref:DUF6894 family protein n=1 Tax=unclassified Mesorhizobium TaxID=325217 RepID=UPI000FCBD85B|nr:MULTISPECIES: hypothetical protein [unclassified Mesorhizobium]TGV88236.1 hypothetical protein EN801_022580 [Mesorhizobium sp. M00.F.Ca.ET.158.01.1.1]MCT2577693.1 hypothetical protein [Mesorhizobium sp. P13.3]MDF3166631.1 hypothetical protein [Mesorhizobium sp. P16.1]MDF3179365.1 hypothetical protein [Mesorhizobium sp. P17.1]MDF3183257.1 hypothetical protein [Mesorhizobium sp. ICCV3110.1]